MALVATVVIPHEIERSGGPGVMARSTFLITAQLMTHSGWVIARRDPCKKYLFRAMSSTPRRSQNRCKKKNDEYNGDSGSHKYLQMEEASFDD
jgi:hypothetical protein